MNIKKILITGVAGFIGYHLAKRLISLGYQVVGIDNLNDYYDVNLKLSRLKELGINTYSFETNKHEKFIFQKIKLQDTDAINELFQKHSFDAVCNLAAQAGVRYSIENPAEYIQSNLTGFGNILEACRNFKIKHLVYASSSSVYGLNNQSPFSETHSTDHPISLYAATKKSNEMMAHSYSHLYDLPTTGLRFFTVYGPWGRPDMALFLFTDAILNDKVIKVFNNGDMYRDFTYIDDIVSGINKALISPPKRNNELKSLSTDTSSAPYEIYNIGNNKPVSLMDFIKAIETATGIQAKKEYLPLQAGDVVSTHADCAKIIKQLDYKSHTSIDDGVNQFVQWYKTFYKS
ncbi:NAD-dependent epimerase [Lentisphaera profundi]|uniref:NAD-dependent epimerase n=1 Tax=Lentisphaera profundi TaxID=1658616 RepID=A0ABY7VZA2_9BACT|nr:NAD-dependent epimerase [Lentisphaera profundi]WDE99124.1 NAD-dependent epimerase [Lentisphaera profundi]